MPWTRPSVSSLPLAHYDGGRGSRRSCSAARAMNRCHTFGRHWNRSMLSKRFQRQQWSQKCSWRWSGYLLCNRSKSSRRKCPTFVATITKGRHFLDSGSCWTAVSVMLACQPLWRCKCPQGVLVRLRIERFADKTARDQRTKLCKLRTLVLVKTSVRQLLIFLLDVNVLKYASVIS